MNKETILMNQMMLEVSHWGGIADRRQVGTFYAPSGEIVKIGIPGTPDIECLFPDGKVIWLEVKTPTGHLRETQKKYIAKLKEYGYEVFVVRSVKEVREILYERFGKRQYAEMEK